jgi:hypothetical protein
VEPITGFKKLDTVPLDLHLEQKSGDSEPGRIYFERGNRKRRGSYDYILCVRHLGTLTISATAAIKLSFHYSAIFGYEFSQIGQVR